MGNWTKFLISKKGEIVHRFEPKDEPLSFEEEIKALLV